MRDRLPFFVYGTLRPGERNHDLFLRGRTTAERPAVLPGARLYEGPGHPYAVDDRGGPVSVAGEAVTAAPEEYRRLLLALDRIEEYTGRPGHPDNLYVRVVRDVVLEDGTEVRAWVYVAAERVARELRARGTPVEGGDWHEAVTERLPGSPTPPAPRTP
ncbi:gamma-glutamylcyclotransferase family protein [Streptomyces sp. NPDC096176]|uniref:gamma-glutamylcyclotransferase family protein n=1 Tax=Streptomyces sp. NPDC096176 TaxID=3366079 RepID=UPI0037FCCC2F